MNKAEVCLKDEGNIGSLFFESERAKKFARENDLHNMYTNMGYYRVDLERSVAKEIAKVFKKEYNLTVEMEY